MNHSGNCLQTYQVLWCSVFCPQLVCMGSIGRTEQRGITSLYQPFQALWLLHCMYHQAQHSDTLHSTYKIYLCFYNSHKKIIDIFLLLFFFSCSVSFLILFLVSLAPIGLNILSFHNWRESMLSLGQELNFLVILKRATCHKFLNIFVRFYFKVHYIFVEKGPAAETTEAPQP